MFLYILKSEFNDKIYWNNPKYKLAKIEEVVNCFTIFSLSKLSLNWTSQRHFSIRITTEPEWYTIKNVFNTKYFLISNILVNENENMKAIYQQVNSDFKIVFLKKYDFLNQQKTFLELYFEVDNFFNLIQYGALRLKGKLNRTTLPKLTYYHTLDKTILMGYVTDKDDIEIGKEKSQPYFLLKELKYISNGDNNIRDSRNIPLKEYYFYLENEKITLKPVDSRDLKENIIRKPLFIPYEQIGRTHYHINLKFIARYLNINIGTKFDFNQIKKLFDETLFNTIKEKFKNNLFLMIFPLYYENENDVHISYRDSLGYYIAIKNVWEGGAFRYKYIENRAFKAVIITNNEIFFCADNFCITYNNLISTNKTFEEELIISKNNHQINFPFTIENETRYETDSLLKSKYFAEKTPENTIKASFYDISREDTNLLLNSLYDIFLSYLHDNNPGIKEYQFINDNVFTIYLRNFKFYRQGSATEKNFWVYYKNNSINLNKDFKNLENVFFNHFNSQTFEFRFKSGYDLIKEIQAKIEESEYRVGINKHGILKEWKEDITSIKTTYNFILNDYEKKYDPKLYLSPSFSQYIIITPNTKTELPINTYINYNIPYEADLNNNYIFQFQYNEFERPEAGYSILSIPGTSLNIVNKYLANDYILNNEYINLLKKNEESINFEKKILERNIDRAYRDNIMNLFSSLTLPLNNFLFESMAAREAGERKDVHTMFSRIHGLQAGLNLVSSIYYWNRGVENAKAASEKFRANFADKAKINYISQDIKGITNFIEIGHEKAFVARFTNKDEWEYANMFLRRWGWKVPVYFGKPEYEWYNDRKIDLSGIKFNKKYEISNYYDYIEFEYVDEIEYQSNEAIEYLKQLFTTGIWMIYDTNFDMSYFLDENKDNKQLEKIIATPFEDRQELS